MTMMVPHPAQRDIPVFCQRQMCWVPGGAFTMGSDRHYPEERPARPARVAGFWMDETPVTNYDFARFVAATDYVTLAEVPPRAEDYPGAPPENLYAGSMVFRAPDVLVPLQGPPLWWDYVAGATWRHPAGPDSSLKGLGDHPVVHVAWEDVNAYCDWAGTALPTEAEWECAARSGLEGAEFAWGDELLPDGVHRANLWQGTFPYHDKGEDGWRGTSPVRSYPLNAYGLADMIGNVWEWTKDWWTTGGSAASCCASARLASVEHNDPTAMPRKVLKGGSHLCAPNFCRRYRPAARHAQPIDSGASHIGFRCIVRPAALE
jgi:sulfatase modifying factor 1